MLVLFWGDDVTTDSVARTALGDQQLNELLELARATDARIAAMQSRLTTSEAKRLRAERWKWPIRLVSAAAGFVISVLSNQVASARWAMEAYRNSESAIGNFLSHGIQIPNGGFISNGILVPWALVILVVLVAVLGTLLANSPSTRERVQRPVAIEQASMFGASQSAKPAGREPRMYSRRPLTVENEVLRIVSRREDP